MNDLLLQKGLFILTWASKQANFPLFVGLNTGGKFAGWCHTDLNACMRVEHAIVLLFGRVSINRPRLSSLSGSLMCSNLHIWHDGPTNPQCKSTGNFTFEICAFIYCTHLLFCLATHNANSGCWWWKSNSFHIINLILPSWTAFLCGKHLLEPIAYRAATIDWLWAKDWKVPLLEDLWV